MTLSLSQQLRQSFDLAALRREAAARLSGKEWERRGVICEHYEMQRAFEKRAFNKSYASRVETVRRRLINEAAQNRKDLRPFFAMHDRFDSDALTAQARREVNGELQARLRRLDRLEARSLTKLVETAERRNRLSKKTKSEFTSAAERSAPKPARQAKTLRRTRS
ncbi:hypothetical protein ACSSV1_004879 [Labrenzia sp. MBR-25]